MISYSELARGTRILFKSQPYEIIESSPMFKGRGQSVLQAKIKNLISGETISYTFRPAESFEEPEISKKDLKFVFSDRARFVFCQRDEPAKRFELKEEQMAKEKDWLKPNQILEGLFFEEKLIKVLLPIKVSLRVTEAAPALKGQSAQAGTKPVTLETGAKINAPLFIKSGDIVEINTETNQYVRRVKEK